MGAPSKVSAALVAQFIAHIREGGCWRDTAAKLVGLSPRTIDVWVSKGKKDHARAEAEHERTGRIPKLNRWGTFLASLEAAEAEIEDEAIGVVLSLARAGTDEGVRLRAATWYLERKSNLRFGRGSQRVDILPPDIDADGDPGQFVMTALTRFAALKAVADERAAGE